MNSLEELTDSIGGRLAGSPAYDRAAAWAAAKFRSYGIQDVRLEPFTIPNGWQRGWAHGQITEPIVRHLTIESVGWGPSTPRGGVRGEVIVVSDVSPEALRARAGELKDRIVLFDHRQAFQRDEHKALLQIRPAYQQFAEMRASAVLLANDRLNNNVLGGRVDNDNHYAAVLPLPVAEIGREDAYLLLRLLKGGPVRMEFDYQNEITGPVTVNNVIAQIPGQRADQCVLVGAHLDSWDYGTGAQDDGAGVVMVLEAARAIASLNRTPLRSIRFALFGAEEPGPLGSRAYVLSHSAELTNCAAMLNTDNGAGRPFGWRAFLPDLKQHLQPIITSW
jgi:carboxypeptidase Q